MALLKIVIDKSGRSLLNYISRDEAAGNSEPIHTNMAGRTPREMSKEFGVFRALRPNLKKAAGHLMITISPEDQSKMTPQAWQRAIDIALEAHGITDAPFAAWLHHDTDHLHCHVFFSRIRADGSVISDSHSYRKNEAAARQMERELGLQPPAPLPPEKQPGDRRALEKATRRAERKGEKLDYLKIKSTIEAALEKGAATPEDLAAALQAAGYRADFTRRGHDPDGEIAGWRIADAEAGEDATAIKASAIHRDLSWAKVGERLAANRPEDRQGEASPLRGQAQGQADQDKPQEGPQAAPERVQSLADAARLALEELDAGATDVERLTSRLEAAGVTVHHRQDDDGQITGWSWEVAGERSAASALDPRLGWGHVQMAIRDAQQRAGLAPPPLGGRPQRGHGLSPAARQAGEASLARRLRGFGFRAVESEGAALWSNRRGDQLRVLDDRVELHPAPRAEGALWDDRAVSAWVLAARLTQGDRLSLVNAGELAPELRHALVEACVAEGVTITELADEIDRERERLAALGAQLPTPGAEGAPLGLRAAPEAPADRVQAAPATDAAQPSQTSATAATQPSPAAPLLSRLHKLRFNSLSLKSAAALRERAHELRQRVHALGVRRFMDAIEDDELDLSLDKAIEKARNQAMASAVHEARLKWDASPAPGQPRFAPLQRAVAEAERAWSAARAVPEPSRLADPLGRAAARRHATIEQAARDLEAARQRMKALNAKIFSDAQRREALDRRTWEIFGEQSPHLLEAEHLQALASDLDKAAQIAESRERQAATEARIAQQREAARQRLQAHGQTGQDNDDENDDQRHYRQRGG